MFRRPLFWWCVGAGVVVLALIWSAYRFSWPGTGFQGKTVWDWLSLLIVPLALALVALLFNQANTRNEQKIAQQRYEQDKEISLDKQREDLLQAYLDRMSDLLLEKGLCNSKPDDEARRVARTRTISTLRQLDARRVGDVFTFLREAKLTNPSDPVVSLDGADLSKVNWVGANLSGANLSGANLSGANLSYADLFRAILNHADLSKSDLSNANLSGANFQRAKLISVKLWDTDLSGANLSHADLSKADLSSTSLNEAFPRAAKLWENTDLSYANFSGVDLSKVILYMADSKGIILGEANLKGAYIAEAKIDKSQLTSEQIAQAVWEAD